MTPPPPSKTLAALAGQMALFCWGFSLWLVLVLHPLEDLGPFDFFGLSFEETLSNPLLWFLLPFMLAIWLFYILNQVMFFLRAVGLVLLPVLLWLGGQRLCSQLPLALHDLPATAKKPYLQHLCWRGAFGLVLAWVLSTDLWQVLAVGLVVCWMGARISWQQVKRNLPVAPEEPVPHMELEAGGLEAGETQKFPMDRIDE